MYRHEGRSIRPEWPRAKKGAAKASKCTSYLLALARAVSGEGEGRACGDIDEAHMRAEFGH